MGGRARSGLFAALMLGALLFAGGAAAHPSPSSEVLLDFGDHEVQAELRLPLVELEIAFKRPLSALPMDGVDRHRAALTTYLLDHVKPATADGRDWQVAVRSLRIGTGVQAGELIASMTLTPPPNADVRHMVLRYDVIADQVPNHVALVSARSDWRGGLTGEAPRLLGTIRFLRSSIAIDRGDGSEWQGFVSVVKLGMRHIAEGTDHLLFLIVLVLTAPLVAIGGRWFGGVSRGESLMRVVKVVSGFTIGHSATLCLGALGLVAIPSAFVEALIAVTILVTAVHAIKPLFAGREACVAAVFGLVHGLAFAETITGMGIGGWRLALALLGFNVGIEATQLLILACLLPFLSILARSAMERPLRIVVALCAAIAAFGWLGRQVTGTGNAVTAAVDTVATHWPWCFVLLAGLALCSLLPAIVSRGASRPLAGPTRCSLPGRLDLQ